MGSATKRILQKIGAYEPLVNIKRKYDKYIHLKSEKKLLKKRLEFYKSFLKENDLVFDVGANIGNRTEIFLKLNTRVIAIEPQHSCVTILKNKFNSRILIEEVGLGSSEGELDMYIADESTISTFSSDFIEKTGSTKFSRNKWGKKEKVRISTLDRLISIHGIPDFCKIDVEGFEPEVLSGLSTPIPLVSFEYNVPDLAQNVYKCLYKLNSLSQNYKFNFCIGESMKPELNNWMDFDSFNALVHTQYFLKSDFGDIYAQINKS